MIRAFCPICNRELIDRAYCSHTIAKKYKVYYDNGLGGITGTSVYQINSDTISSDTIRMFRCNGFVFLDESRLEKLLLLK
jgi:hypothetical protein